MSTPVAADRPRVRGIRPGPLWRWARRLTQLLALLAVVVAPVLGGWQRLDRAELAQWDSDGRELPDGMRDRLPLGTAPSTAYDSNRLLGGGIAVEYFDVPLVMDPLAGAIALMTSEITTRALLAFGIPLLVALLAGRVFCGWLCPFGTVARLLRSLLVRLPWRWPGFALPATRPVRYVILAAAIAGSLFGIHLILYLALPHLLLQQSVYAAWLLGGGSAVLAVLGGLLVTVLIFGPTTYCAAVCPTGGALGLAGRARVVRLKIAEPASCGTRCRLCDRACWLQLDPASGDPGPDCDLCARCVPACPKTNLRVGLGRGRLKVLAPGAILLALFLPGHTAAQGRAPEKPRIVLHGEVVRDGATVAVDVVDYTGVRLGVDSETALTGIEISAFVARGERGEADERGVLPSREVYGGPLMVRLRHADGRAATRVEFDQPTSPRSTPARTIYRRRIEVRLQPGDTVEVAPIEGWTDSEVRWTVPPPGVAAGGLRSLGFFAAGALIFMGLLSLALAAGRRPGGAGAVPRRKAAAPRPAGERT